MQKRIVYVSAVLIICAGCMHVEDMNSLQNLHGKSLTVINPIQISRLAETISLDWDKAKASVPDLTEQTAAIYDVQDKQLIVTQFVDIDGSTELLFQTDLMPGQTKTFRLIKLPEDINEICISVVTALPLLRTS